MGSLEGVLLDVGTDYNQPALLVKDRRTNTDIWCRVTEDVKAKISGEASFEDVWDHRRVIVRGRIRYDDSGNITRVYAQTVIPLKPRAMTLNDIKDTSFGADLDVETYLNQLRDGAIGD